MRKFLALIMAVATTTPLLGSYSGNPALPSLAPESLTYCGNEWVKLRLEFQHDSTYDRKLRSTDEGFRIDRFTIQADQGVATLAICDTAEIYASVGGAVFDFYARPGSPAQIHREFQTFDRAIWSVGGRAILYDSYDTVIGLTANYQHAQPLMVWDGLHETMDPTQMQVEYSEWQVGLGIAQRIGLFTPYATATYSTVHGSATNIQQNISPTAVNVPFDSFNLRSRHHAGAAFGVTIGNYESFYINFEARVFNESACTIAGGLTF